jgi:hypothetical protein
MDGVGGGTGILVFPDGGDRPQRPRITDGHIKGNLSSEITIGWILESTDFGFVSHVFSEDIVGSDGIGFAHELKDDASYTNMHALTAKYAESAFAHGGEALGAGNGAAYNLLMGLIGSAVDKGIDSSWGIGNVHVGAVINADGRPESIAQSYALDIAGTEDSAFVAIGAYGAGVNARSVLIDGDSARNFVQLFAHAEGTVMARVSLSARSNVIEIAHPGTRTSILGGPINDDSGAPAYGDGANVYYSPATGEWIGSLSGYMTWLLGNPAVTFNAAHRFRFGHDDDLFIALGTPDGTDVQAGIVHGSPASDNQGSFFHNLGSTSASNTWRMSLAGTQRYVWTSSQFRPASNDGASLGNTTVGWSDLYLAAGGEIRLNNVQLLDTVGGLSTQSATAAAIAAVGNAINTANKRAGKMVWDTTNTRLMVATGSAAADAWKVADGATTVTPA